LTKYLYYLPNRGDFMALTVIAGMLIGFGSLILAFILEGGAPAALIAGTAALIVLGGTFGATFVGYSLPEILKLPSVLKVAFTDQKIDPLALIEEITHCAALARREGFVGQANRARNRRVDIIVLKEAYNASEPHAGKLLETLW
jgi:flagellar motor component MotA